MSSRITGFNIPGLFSLLLDNRLCWNDSIFLQLMPTLFCARGTQFTERSRCLLQLYGHLDISKSRASLDLRLFKAPVWFHWVFPIRWKSVKILSSCSKKRFASRKMVRGQQHEGVEPEQDSGPDSGFCLSRPGLIPSPAPTSFVHAGVSRDPLVRLN